MKRIVALAIVLCMTMYITGYASETPWEMASENHGNSVLLPAEEIGAKDEFHTVARGDFLSGGALEILNGQDGSMTINIDTYAHHNVDRIFHSVFLDQWDEDNQDWCQVNYWNFVRSKNDVENGELSYLITSFTVTGYETGKYYRVRGLHGVEYNDEVEATATETNGILITDGPT